MDFKTVMEQLLTRFHERGIRYGLMGGFALGLWGVPRATVDLDFLVDRVDMDAVESIMRDLGYERRFRSENVTQYISPSKLFGEVDFLHAFRQASLEMLDRAATKEIFGGAQKIRTLCPEDLIGLKLQAIKNNPSRRESDLADIKQLSAAQKGRIDWLQVERYAEILDARDLLKELMER